MRNIVVLLCLLMAMPFVNLPNVSAAATEESHDTLGSGRVSRHARVERGSHRANVGLRARVFTGRVINLITYAYGK
jgi:hypothetical protein